LLIVTTVAWLWSIVAIAREKTADPLDRIVWLMIVLMLNVIGTVLYVLFSGTKKANPHDESELKRRANEGTLR
jgi:heme/copper-type cytochrome/quinol oxidase subunit 2